MATSVHFRFPYDFTSVGAVLAHALIDLHAALAPEEAVPESVQTDIDRFVALMSDRDRALEDALTPGARGVVGSAVYQAAAQSIPNATQTQINFESVDYDDLGIWDATAFRFQIRQAGLYLINTSVKWAPNTSGTRGCFMFKNGTAAGGGVVLSNVTGPPTLLAGDATAQLASAIVKLAAGDTVFTVGYQTSGATLTTDVGGTHVPNLQIGYLGSL